MGNLLRLVNLDRDLVVGVDCVVTVVVVPAAVGAAADCAAAGPLTRVRIRCRLVCRNLSEDEDEAELEASVVAAEVEAVVPAGGANLWRERTRLVTRLTASTGDGVAATPLTSLREGLLTLLLLGRLLAPPFRYLFSAFSLSMNFLRWSCFLACCSNAF